MEDNPQNGMIWPFIEFCKRNLTAVKICSLKFSNCIIFAVAKLIFVVAKSGQNGPIFQNFSFLLLSSILSTLALFHTLIHLQNKSNWD
jgi:hypothetical protein